MNYQACLEKINSNNISPDDFWNIIQNMFCIPSLELFFYIILGTLFVFIYKTSQELYTRYIDNSKTELESILDNYIEIKILSDHILSSSPIDLINVLNFYDNVKKSFNYIEYHVYVDLEELLVDSNLSDFEKIKKINGVVSKKIPKLIKKKNYFINYDSGLKGSVRPFIISLLYILIPTGITLGTILFFLIIIPILFNQPNKFEFSTTFIAIFLSLALLYDFEEMIKSKIQLQKVLYVLMVLVTVILVFTNNTVFTIFLITFFILFSIYVILGINYYRRLNQNI